MAGEDKISNFTLQSTRHTKSFCSVCGSALPALQMDGNLLVVPAGSVDSHLPIKPNAHINTSSKANWDHELEKIPIFNEYPEST